MIIYDVPNIEHCTVVEIGNPVVGYRINSHEGWYLHAVSSSQADNIYKTAMALGVNYDFSRLSVVAEADLPENAEILAIENETETM